MPTARKAESTMTGSKVAPCAHTQALVSCSHPEKSFKTSASGRLGLLISARASLLCSSHHWIVEASTRSPASRHDFNDTRA